MNYYVIKLLHLEVAINDQSSLYIVRQFNADIARLSAHQATMRPDAYPRLLDVSCVFSVHSSEPQRPDAN